MFSGEVVYIAKLLIFLEIKCTTNYGGTTDCSWCAILHISVYFADMLQCILAYSTQFADLVLNKTSAFNT